MKVKQHNFIMWSYESWNGMRDGTKGNWWLGNEMEGSVGWITLTCSEKGKEWVDKE